MKKSILLVAFMLFGMIGAQAQDIIKTGPIALAFGSFNACYEKVLNEKSSVVPSASAFFGIGDLTGTAFGVGVGYRRYFTDKPAPQGFYGQPQVGATFGEGASAISLGAELGYQWVWDSGFALDLGIGPAYYIGLGDNVVGAFSGVVPSSTLAIGYQFGGN